MKTEDGPGAKTIKKFGAWIGAQLEISCSKFRKLRGRDYKEIWSPFSVLSLSFVLRQLKTNLRLTEPETIKVLELKNDLEFEHRLRNLKLASYLTQT